MSKSAVVLAVAGIFGATSAMASTFLPPNNLDQEDNVEFLSSMTQDQFEAIIKKVEDAYRPLAAKHGAKLVGNNKWTDSTVNASAQQSGKNWVVNMYGGLARRPEITADGFTLVVCHETGHHFGGFPFYSAHNWGAVEGQADYFSTLACARKVWTGEVQENAQARLVVSSFVKEKCDAVWKTENEQNVCYRIAIGGLSLANLLATLEKAQAPTYESPDASKANSTVTGHPAAQCRLDTYLAGALCTAKFEDDVIPARNHKKGQMSVPAETESAKYNCTASGKFEVGLRPNCWFKARL